MKGQTPSVGSMARRRSSRLMLVPMGLAVCVVVGAGADEFLAFGPLQSAIRTGAGVAAIGIVVAFVLWAVITTRPEFFPLVWRGISLRRAVEYSRVSNRGSWAVLVAAPILILTLGSLARTLAIHTNDLFHFGASNRWWCYTIVNYGLSRASIETYAPGEPPRHLGPAHTGSGWFFYHLAAQGGTWAISGGPPADLVAERNLYICGYYEYAVGGRYNGRMYWIDLPFLFPILTLLSAIPVAVWLRGYGHFLANESAGRCPICGYDLRAHKVGEKCPECGTVVSPAGVTVARTGAA